MVEEGIERRLTAILAADVAGYTRAMGGDEVGTLAQLQELLINVVRPAVASHQGRVFKEMGDGILAEFPSAVGAAQCATAIQDALAASASRLKLRIGLHVGDVIVEGDDLFGKGVNIAARLQAEAEPGGIVASENFRSHADGRAGMAFDDLGARRLKNVTEPMHVFQLRREGSPVARRTPLRLRRSLVTGVVLVALAFAVIWAWQEVNSPSPKRAAGIPVVAVLPFENLSADPEQAFFADGLAEDLITDLSKLQGLQVVARTSSFTVDRKLPTTEIGARLHAGYIVIGSVRRSGEQLRITANLIDAAGDKPLWAERFDGSGSDVFGFQDEITAQIIEALRVQLTPAELRAVESRGTNSPEAYDAYLRGLRLISARRRLDAESNQAAQAAFEEAIRLDPDYALAYAGLGWAKWVHYESINYYSDPGPAFELAEKSLSLADNALAHRTLARRHFSLQLEGGGDRDLSMAVAELEAARSLQPGDPDVLADLASALSFVGRSDEALTLVFQAMERNPDHPKWYYAASGVAYLLTEQPKFAIRDLQRWADSTPNWPVPHLFLASAFGLAGEEGTARAELDLHNKLYGAKYSIFAVDRTWPMAPREREIFHRGLILAGISDPPG